MAKIYTKTGDQGQTALLGGVRLSKNDSRIEVYGTVDELNSFLGWTRRLCKDTKNTAIVSLGTDLEVIQHWLFDLGGLLAAESADRVKYKLRPVTEKHVTWLEKKIDEAHTHLAPLQNFILPGGAELGARLHVCRTVARRAERLLVALEEAQRPAQSIEFLNRLSDYFFAVARLANTWEGQLEERWVAKEP